MENWFFIALIAPILWSIVNHIDKNILSRYQEGRGVGAILIFSSLSSVVILPFIIFFFILKYLAYPFRFLLLMMVGFLSAAAFYFYLQAMNIEEASVVIPLFQFDPVFGYILSYFILKESLNVNQIFSFRFDFNRDYATFRGN